MKSELQQMSEADLEKTASLLKGDREFRGLGRQAEMELVRRKLPKMEDVFPEGGYVEENEDGNWTLVPLK